MSCKLLIGMDYARSAPSFQRNICILVEYNSRNNIEVTQIQFFTTNARMDSC